MARVFAGNQAGSRHAAINYSGLCACKIHIRTCRYCFCKMHYSGSGLYADNGMATGGFSTSLDFNYNEEEVPKQVVCLPIPTPAESLAVTAILLEYYSEKNGHLQKMTNKAFMPTGMVSAKYF